MSEVMDDPVSNYELLRAQNIMRNREMLAKLQIIGVATVPKKKPPKPAEKLHVPLISVDGRSAKRRAKDIIRKLTSTFSHLRRVKVETSPTTTVPDSPERKISVSLPTRTSPRSKVPAPVVHNSPVKIPDPPRISGRKAPVGLTPISGSTKTVKCKPDIYTKTFLGSAIEPPHGSGQFKSAVVSTLAGELIDFTFFVSPNSCFS